MEAPSRASAARCAAAGFVPAAHFGSRGGTGVGCRRSHCHATFARQVPAALGEPVFDRLEAKLAHAMLSLPATKGFEFGSGFSGTSMRGSAHNGA